MGDYGRCSVEDYPSNQMSGQRIENMENLIREWIATMPGSFHSRSGGDIYNRARNNFLEWSGWKSNPFFPDVFEIALARAGFRAGTIVFKGEPLWVLILPSSLDGALERLSLFETEHVEAKEPPVPVKPHTLSRGFLSG